MVGLRVCGGLYLLLSGYTAISFFSSVFFSFSFFFFFLFGGLRCAVRVAVENGFVNTISFQTNETT